MFCDYDINRSGTIDLYEVQKILFTMGIENFEKKAIELMEIVDVDGSGEIDFDEFCRFIVLLKKGEGAFAEFSKMLDTINQTPLGANIYSFFFHACLTECSQPFSRIRRELEI
jgi:hypothetical protein